MFPIRGDGNRSANRRERDVRITILGAECNNNRLFGYENPDACLRAFLRGEFNDNPGYWQRTVLQIQVGAALCNIEEGDYTFRKSDVNLSTETGGKHSPKPDYFEGVRKSVPDQVRHFQQHPSPIVLVAGGYAFEAFVKHVLPELIRAGVAPQAVVKMRNAGAQGHRGKPEAWADSYRSVLADPTRVGGHVLAQLRAALQQSGATECFELKSKGAGHPFALTHVKTVRAS